MFKQIAIVLLLAITILSSGCVEQAQSLFNVQSQDERYASFGDSSLVTWFRGPYSDAVQAHKMAQPLGGRYHFEYGPYEDRLELAAEYKLTFLGGLTPSEFSREIYQVSLKAITEYAHQHSLTLVEYKPELATQLFRNDKELSFGVQAYRPSDAAGMGMVILKKDGQIYASMLVYSATVKDVVLNQMDKMVYVLFLTPADTATALRYVQNDLIENSLIQ